MLSSAPRFCCCKPRDRAQQSGCALQSVRHTSAWQQQPLGNLLGMQIHGPCCGPAQSQSLGVESSSCALTGALGTSDDLSGLRNAAIRPTATWPARVLTAVGHSGACPSFLPGCGEVPLAPSQFSVGDIHQEGKREFLYKEYIKVVTEFFPVYCKDVPCCSKPIPLLFPESLVQKLPQTAHRHVPPHPTPISQIALLQGQSPLHMRTHNSLVIRQSEQILCSLLNLVLLCFH